MIIQEKLGSAHNSLPIPDWLILPNTRTYFPQPLRSSKHVCTYSLNICEKGSGSSAVLWWTRISQGLILYFPPLPPLLAIPRTGTNQDDDQE